MNNNIIPSFALVLAIGIFFVYVNPTYTGAIAQTQAGITADDQALAAAQRYAAQQNQLASARDAIDSASQTLLTDFLPDSVDNVGMILDLNALAARSGLSISKIDALSGSSAAQTDQSSPISSIDISLSGTGTLAAFQAFLTGVEQSRRLLDVHDVTIKGSDTGAYNYSMILRLYWLR